MLLFPQCPKCNICIEKNGGCNHMVSNSLNTSDLPSSKHIFIPAQFPLTSASCLFFFQQCSKCKHGKLDLEEVFSAGLVSGDVLFSFFCDMEMNCEHWLKYFSAKPEVNRILVTDWSVMPLFCILFPTGCGVSCILIQCWFDSFSVTCPFYREISISAIVLPVESISEKHIKCFLCNCHLLKILAELNHLLRSA